MNTRTALYPYEVEFNVKSTDVWNEFRKAYDAPGTTEDEKSALRVKYDNDIEQLVKDRKLAEAKFHGSRG